MMPDIERGQVGGVPVLRSDAIAGGNTAALIFRVGRFDEPLTASGITHMVEHLAFAGHLTAPYTFNASVSGRYTAFYMTSENSTDIADFVDDVCRGLTSDEGAALDRERIVLRTEAASRGGAGALGRALTERYGADSGPGIMGYQEYGVHHLGWTDVAAWRQRWFTARNAVLVVSGDLPTGLRLSLPDGTLASSADPVSRPLALPGFLCTGNSGIGLSLVRSRTSVSEYAAAQVLRERLTRVLRHELGITYSVNLTEAELGPGLAHTWITADALADQAPMVAHALLGELESLIDGGSAETEVKEVARRMRATYSGPAAPWARLQRAARDILNGRTSRDPEESIRLVGDLGPTHVAEAARALRDQMIVAVPWALPSVQGRMAALPTWSQAAVSGTALRSADSDATLTVGSDGVTLTSEPGRHDPAHHLTVRYGEIAALVRSRDNRHELIGADGFSVQVDPDEWPRGDRVVADIARQVGPERTVALGTEGAPRPGRGRDSGKVDSGAVKAAPSAERRSRRRRLAIRWGLRAVYAGLIVGGLVGFGPAGAFVAFIGLLGLLTLELGYSPPWGRFGRRRW